MMVGDDKLDCLKLSDRANDAGDGGAGRIATRAGAKGERRKFLFGIAVTH